MGSDILQGLMHLHARGALPGESRGPDSHRGLRAQQGGHGCCVRHRSTCLRVSPLRVPAQIEHLSAS